MCVFFFDLFKKFWFPKRRREWDSFEKPVLSFLVAGQLKIEIFRIKKQTIYHVSIGNHKKLLWCGGRRGCDGVVIARSIRWEWSATLTQRHGMEPIKGTIIWMKKSIEIYKLKKYSYGRGHDGIRLELERPKKEEKKTNKQTRKWERKNILVSGYFLVSHKNMYKKYVR